MFDIYRAYESFEFCEWKPKQINLGWELNYLYFNYVIPLLKYVLQPLNAKSVINSTFFLRENIKFNNKDRCPPYLPFYEHLTVWIANRKDNWG